MSKKAKETNADSQLSLDFSQKAMGNTTKKDNINNNPKVVYLDSRQGIYKKILERKML
jgi:hypothetical protein